MAAAKIVVTPRYGPPLMADGSGGRPIVGEQGGWKWAKVTLQIPASTTYDTTNRCVLVHDGQDFSSQYGSRIIRQVIFSNGFPSTGPAYGELKGEWSFANQYLVLRRVGNGGPGTGPLDDAEIGAINIGTGTIVADATIYY